MKEDLKKYLIEKLTQLKIQAVFEDKARGKTRYVSKRSAYQDLINLIKEVE